jgi:hypothetical protein
LFEDEADLKQSGFTTYINQLEAQGDAIITTLQTDYRNEIDQFEATQEQVFNTWFDFIKGQLSEDVAGRLENQIMNNEARLLLLEDMVLQNDFVAPLITDDATMTVLTDDLGNALLADWKYKEV